MNPCLSIIFSVLLLCLETTTAKKCLDKERHALLHFKAPLQDPNGWLSTWSAEDNNCCNWLGIMCNNQTGHVIGLEIYDCNLVGEISNSLLKLSYLNHLDLSFSSFHGTIPTFIGSMTPLRYLHLGYNKFNGTILRSIGSLTKLRYLDPSSNPLFGTIPPEFRNLTNLQTLILATDGRFKVENLIWLSHLSYLEKLVMDGISLAKQNYWVDVILSLPRLSDLSLEECVLSQVMYPYSSFANSSSSIDSLSLRDNNLTSSMYRWLFPLVSNKLRELSLAYNMLDGIPKYLGNFCSLNYLDIEKNFAVINFPDFLNNLSGCASLTLRELYATGSQFTGSVSGEMQTFSSLTDLNLYKNQLNGTISEKLWELPRLNTLDLSFNHLRGSISENIGKSKAVMIKLSNNTLLEGVPSTDHMSNLSYVSSLFMGSCNLGPRFPKWIQTLKNLTQLNIPSSRISDTIPSEFWVTWPSRLKYLNHSSNNISGNIPDLVSNFANNSVIDLSSNRFYGPIPNVSSTMVSLNLSRNKFSGGVSFF